MPRVSLYLGLGVCVKALACGAREWFSPGYVAVGAGAWELCGGSSTQGLSCLLDLLLWPQNEFATGRELMKQTRSH